MSILKPMGCVKCPLYKHQLIPGIGSKPASVVILMDSPPPWATVALTGRDGDMIKSLLTRAARTDATGLSEKLKATCFYMYAVSCASKVASSVKLLKQCASNVGYGQLLSSGADTILAFGPKALSFLGIKSLHSNVRGTVLEVTVGQKVFKVIPTFGLSKMFESVGVVEVACGDIAKAAKVAFGHPLDNIDVPSLLANYDIVPPLTPYKPRPKDLEDAISIINEYCEYTAPGKTKANTMMSLDFETTTLFPWNTEGRVIAISACVGEGKALSLYVFHKLAPYSFGGIIPYIWKLLQSPHAKTWWNYKFDYGIAKHILVRQTKAAMAQHSGLKSIIEEVVGKPIEAIFANPVNNTRWDGMLAEHMLDEDKKGLYSLKKVVLEHYPSLAKYEEPLVQELSSITKQLESTLSKAALTNAPAEFKVLSPLGSSDLESELEEIKTTIKEIKKLLRLKSTPSKHKLVMESTLNMLGNRTKYIKEVRSATAKMLRTEFSNVSGRSRIDPFHEKVTFEMVDPNIMIPYAAIDADLTYRLSTMQRVKAWKEDPKSKADSENRAYMMSLMDKHYIPVTEVLSDMQVEGVRIDRDYLVEQCNILKEREITLKEDLLTRISTELSRPRDSIVLNNPSDLANIMIAGYGLPSIKKTDTGAHSCSNEVLSKWAETNPIAQTILDYRAAVKGRSTYLDNLLQLSGYDGRVHGNINANGTATGRFSSSNPNLQNQPPVIAGVPIKKAFVPTDTSSEAKDLEKKLCLKYGWEEEEDLCVVDLDFAGAEVRGLTVYARDPGLLEALNKGLDMHSWIASIVFEKDYDAINIARQKDKVVQTDSDKELVTLRQQAKAIVFGLIFCIGPAKLALQLGIEAHEAQGLMDMFFARFPKVEEYISGTKAKVRREGILRTPTGRARRFPLAFMGGSVGSSCQRQGVNYLVQGFTSEIVCRTLINLHKRLSEVKGRLLLTVHDSIVFEMPTKLLETLPSFLESAVRDFIKTEFPIVPVALPYDVEVGPSYGEAKYSIEAYCAKIKDKVV
mgnify:CR=1 FL=1|tara:strand:+ start:25530 stop:28598 length:3069 start_codon:yes stop_codon:yes gene_type:complete